MTTSSTGRRGSALLIVLGMVAFMVVSAVGFSVFMRQNRAPSGYLRRSTLARHLGRAALSAAMAEIEYSMSSGERRAYLRGGGDGGGASFLDSENFPHKPAWRGRVLFPRGDGVDDGGVDVDYGNIQYELPTRTTYPFAFESLAYIPPPFVNDVRFFSRWSSTALWQRLDYDAGRVSYCVVDVTDCFDLGRCLAGKPRGSADDSLVTTTYLFSDGDFREFENDPCEFQKFIDDRAASTEGPLVSMADYNVALHKDGTATGLVSPFCRYVEDGAGGGDSGNFYGFADPPGENPWRDSQEFRRVAMQRFIADGLSELRREEWFGEPPDGSDGIGSDVIDISLSENQPFPELMQGQDDKDRNDMSASRHIGLSMSGHKFIETFSNIGNARRYMNPFETIALYDYLDRDNVPTSVALPTVERAPMIVAVENSQEDALSFKITSKGLVEDGEITEGDKTYKKFHQSFHLQVDGSVTANVGFAFPFKWRKELNGESGSYKAQAFAALYMLREDDRCEPGQGGRQGCRMGGNMAKELGSGMRGGGEASSKFQEDGCYLLMRSQTQETGLPSDKIDSEEKAVSTGGGGLRDVQLSFTLSDLNDKLEKDEQAIATYYFRQLVSQNGTPIGGGELEFLEAKCNNGMKAVNVASGSGESMEFEREYILGMSLAVNLKNRDGRLVDCAPAHPEDDEDALSGDFKAYADSLGRPVLRFDAPVSAEKIVVRDGIEGYNELKQKVDHVFSVGALAAAGGRSVYLTDDPRFNYASENWYPANVGGDTLGKEWLNKATRRENGKDGDIFMSVSNAGYLQDAGEIAFIPKLVHTVESENSPTPWPLGVIPSDAGDCGARDMMWRTYDCFTEVEDGKSEIDLFGIASPVNGFRANPYSKDDIVRLAPFVNTPYDWWAASTNYEDSVKSKLGVDEDGFAGSKSDLEKALKYTFGAKGEEAKVEATAMEGIASRIYGDIGRDRDSGDWYKRWLDMKWMTETDNGTPTLLGVDFGGGVNLHSVDRKFLCTYWRKCFANQQQLFLVFFRAEPIVLGGGMSSTTLIQKTPAQLGVKAVAVVWRDPHRKSGTPDDAPNRMRVLFYHQFD